MSQSTPNMNETSDALSEGVISEYPFECILDESSSEDDSSPVSQVLPNTPETSENLSKPGIPSATVTASASHRQWNNLSEDDVDEVILAMIWLKGRVGAAYYNIATSELFIMDDIIEDDFNYCITRTLYRQSQPRYVITSSASPDAFTNILKKLIVKDTADTSMSSGSGLNRASQVALKILSKNANTFDDCVHRVNLLKLTSEPEGMSPTERVTFLNSVLNYNSKLMIHALGMLLKYIDTNWGKLALDPNGEAVYLYVNYIRLKDLVMIEEDTYKELNIMQTKYHSSLFKVGGSVKKEGMNLFALLNRCQTRIGLKSLWRLMQQPTRNLNVLQDRFRVTEFFLDPDNKSLFESLRSNLKTIVRLTPALLNRYATPLAKPHDWKRLSASLSSVIHIGELCNSCRGSAMILGKIADSVTKHMHQSRYFIDYIVDLEVSKQQRKFVVRAGVDSELDELNDLRKSLPDILADYVTKDMPSLPDTVDSAKLIYLSDIGFLLAITGWIGEPPEDEKIEGMEFKCSIGGIRHYKSAAATELDESVGDIFSKITHRQSVILMKLVDFINEDLGSIAKAIDYCAELDALISLSTVARDYNYTQPKMVKSHVIDIKNGRHPLRELFREYVPNDTQSGDGSSLIKILSGPNACGKTAYMKQIALIVYLAHIGCYVPASSATIGVITNILTQIPAVETSCYNASSFLIDLRQVHNILYSSTPNSLIIMDEFGKGTFEVDGLALLASILNNFIKRKNYCPHVFLATHMHRIGSLLPPDPILELQMFEYIVSEEKSLIFLYKVISGCADTSFAHEVARSMGLEDDVLAEAVETFESMKRGEKPVSKPQENGTIMMRRIVNMINDKENAEAGKLKDLIKNTMMRKL